MSFLAALALGSQEYSNIYLFESANYINRTKFSLSSSLQIIIYLLEWVWPRIIIIIIILRGAL